MLLSSAFHRQVIGLTAAAILVLFAGGCDPTRPAHALVGSPPPTLDASIVRFRSGSGNTILGWFAKGRPGGGAVLLLHGVGSNRTAMLGRAQFLHDAGYTVLAPDFQAHGESDGKHITFGARESLDAQSAIRFIRDAVPGERIGVIGVSLGGAATLLGPEPLDADALVLESVYPTIENAISDRLHVWLGPFGFLAGRLTPGVLDVIWRETGVSARQLQPIEHVGDARSPVLILTGSVDRYTPLIEARALFRRSPAPKQFWIVDGAGHEDLHAYAPGGYEELVGGFLAKWLRHSDDRVVASGVLPPRGDSRCGYVTGPAAQQASDQGKTANQLRADDRACQ